MSSQFDFLDKHYCATESVQVAAQAVFERYGPYPRARTAVAVYAIDWQAWTDTIADVVRAYAQRGAASRAGTATLDASGKEWRIVLTGMRYVSAGRYSQGGGATYRVNEYRDGTVQLKASAVGNPPQLGEVTHFEHLSGTLVGPVELSQQ
ncbi:MULTISPECIES: hypothetical protein [unclassified Lysobacter]|uniref:hypothetical protein n=1 Tax=unclassified Lysobacter TaxID=2635362 RepID=UPI0006F9081E|nr:MULTISPECIES: hypothetical protein [unclassified Lysobacter]KRA14593.1 hypothetical protein ASD69_19830 [Lysobacter sp. Root604]KRD34331.1 hypothetical protein ASE35_11520 [Lysobacter sp. Root916]KRD72754.1 hypothetical protein ASE43_19240 [Lysobacter sp. Root983]